MQRNHATQVSGRAPRRSRPGHVEKDGALAVPSPLTRDRDVAISLRDGIVIYADIYRPAEVTGPLPAILVGAPTASTTAS